MMKSAFLCFFLIVGVFGDVSDTKGSKVFVTANLNDYVDDILPAIINFMVNNDMDPMDLPDLMEGFSVKPLLIEYHGELELTEGVLHNLKSLKRVGDTIVSYGNKILKIRGDFGVKDLGFDYEYLAKIMNIGPTGGVVGKVAKASFLADFLIDFNSNEIHLQDFYMHDLGKISVKLTGHILVDFLSNAMVKVITTLFKNVIYKIVEENLRNALQDAIDDINSSMGGATGFIAGINIGNYDFARPIKQNNDLTSRVLISSIH